MQALFAARGDIARALNSNPGLPWRRDALLPRRRPLKTIALGLGPQTVGALQVRALDSGPTPLAT
jgi:hypothetical protein